MAVPEMGWMDSGEPSVSDPTVAGSQIASR